MSKSGIIAVFSIFGMIFCTPDRAIAQCYGAAPPAHELSFSVVPQFPPSVIFETWIPVLSAVGQKFDACFELTVEDNIPEFERELAKGSYDFAYANPFHAVMARHKAGYTPQIVDGARLLTGIIVVNKNSKLKTLQDLDGGSFAVPAPNAFGASILTTQDLEQKGVDVSVEYVGTHSNVYRYIARGMVDAGGGVNNTLQKEHEDLRSQLRVLYETRGYPSHPIVSHERISSDVTSAFVDAFLQLSEDEEMLSALRQIQIPVPRVARYDDDYSHLEDMYFSMQSNVSGN